MAMLPDFHSVFYALLADCPYEMYWYGNHMQFQKSGGKVVTFVPGKGPAKPKS